MRRPALPVFAALLAGVSLAPWVGWLWPVAGLLLLLPRARSPGRCPRADAHVLGAVLLLGAGYAAGPPAAPLPRGPLQVQGSLAGAPRFLPGRVERVLRVGDRRLRATFPAGLHRGLGAQVTVVGAARGADALQVHAVQGLPQRSGLLASVRRGVRRTLSGGPRGRRLLRAVVTGDRSGLDPRLRQAFRNTGCAHLLSISGLHVGVILAWALWLARRVGSTWARGAVVGACLLAFVALAGPRPPTLRAAVAGAVWVLAPGRGDPLNRLSCAGVAVLLWEPSSLESLGFLLSFGTVSGMLLFAPPPSRAANVVRGWVAVFVVSSLMLAVTLGHVPWINLVLGPPCVLLLGLLLPCGLLGCAVALIAPDWSAWVLAPADAVGSSLLWLVEAGARSGGWSWLPPPEAGFAALGLGAGFIAGLRRRDGRPWHRWALAGGLALGLGWWPSPPAGMELRIDSRRSLVYLVDRSGARVWGGGPEPTPREQRWSRELGGPWRRVALAPEPQILSTPAGRVCVVRRPGAQPPPGPVELLVILRPGGARDTQALLEATRPREVLAPARLLHCLAGERVTVLPRRGEARFELDSRR